MRKYQKTSLLLFFMLATIFVLEVSCVKNELPPSNTPNNQPQETEKALNLIFPLDKVSERVTKKTFGLYVSPKKSPVSPEKFTGYHTGTDFETFPSEKDAEISIKAICTGPLLLKKWATGYGGVAVQQCTLNKERVTVVYGHLKLESITAHNNIELQTGDTL